MDGRVNTESMSRLLSADAPRFRWTPFDTAWGTLAVGVVVTAVLVVLLRVLTG
jgi:hypothetical protein